ncbi:hypothetical protein GCM10010172_55790 [Paractinoplanes ferrugineus]|uniref:Uncharacterized protein n=1 Tax=Paractinoplanes ferrugineus TaxID=113564 RepID=A0A919MFU9_9ACTN|nr:hypothetical protein [Actinoplanes ferrugineus]GIE10950.1 hypothetical protein Afe05nite_27900 [Actinoplanes ferrugineus]
MSLRSLGRLGVAALVIAGALGIAAAPALAADVDLSLSVTGTTIAQSNFGKHLTIDLVNRGTTKPAKASLILDTSEVDASKASVTYDGPGCTSAGKIRTCPLSETSIPGPGATKHFWVQVDLVPNTSQGSAGKITASIKADGDATTANDITTVELKVGSRGPDIKVYADDVTARAENGAITPDPVVPGKITTLPVFVSNEGVKTAQGIKVSIKLPEHAVFVMDKLFDGCFLSADRRTVDCAMSQYNLRPRLVTDSVPTGWSIDLYFDVQVATDAVGPILRGGVVSAGYISPDYGDVDSTDDSDTFVVMVAGPAGTASPSPSASASASPSATSASASPSATSASPSASPSRSASASVTPAASGRGGGGLAITGPTGMVTGGTGLALVMVGTALVVATRRRRADIEH